MTQKKYEPTLKAPDITKFLNMSVDRDAMIRKSMCVACHLGIKEFKNEVSEREYTISGLCQDCQDHIGLRPPGGNNGSD